MGRTILSTAAAIGLGLVLAGACRIPSTIGLPCKEDEHCDPGQHCGMEVCRPGPRPPPMDMSTGPVDPSTTGDMGSTNTSDGGSTTSTGGGTTVSLEDSGSSSSTGEDTCGIANCLDVDLLVVLDNSPSMYQWLLPLASSLPSLISKYAGTLEQVCTFHLGLVNGNDLNEDNPEGCQGVGSLLHRPEKCGGGDGVLPWWSEQDGTPEEVLDELRCLIIDQGTGGSEDEMMLASLMSALDPASSEDGACNAGFRRPEAHLMVLFVTDEDDPTPMDQLDDLAAQFREWVEPSEVAFVSVVADDADECPWDEMGTDTDGSGAQLPAGLNGFLALTDIPFDQQAIVDICETDSYDFGDAFLVIGQACGLL